MELVRQEQTTDIPAELRRRATGPATDHTHEIMRDAADEIERLRMVVRLYVDPFDVRLEHREIVERCAP